MRIDSSDDVVADALRELVVAIHNDARLHHSAQWRSAELERLAIFQEAVRVLETHNSQQEDTV